jgi:hypothetical protein
MSYINKIDILIYESINEIYSDMKNEKLSKIKSFGHEESYLNIIQKYINKNESKKKLKDILKNSDQINKIHDVIEKYIIIYCILYFGIKLNYEPNLDNASDVFVQNVLNISTTNKFKQLTSTLNSIIIDSYKLYNNLFIIIDNNLTEVSDDLQNVVKFIEEIGQEQVEASFQKGNKDREHNAILMIIFRNIYVNDDKNGIIQIFEEENIKNAEFKYITIVDSKFEIIDYSTIESLLNIDEINGGLTQSLYNLLLEFDNIDLLYTGPEKKINELFEKQLLIPITDEFLRYHKDSEKYEKIDASQDTKINANERSNKRNDTKLKYIITRINKVTDYYTPNQDKSEIEKILYHPMLNRKVVLYNDTEEIAIINKFMNMGRVNIENSEFFSDLKQMRQYPYINYKDFEKIGFQLKTNNYIDAIRYSNIEFLNNSNIIGSVNRPLELRSLSKGMISNIVGVAFPVSIFNNNQKIRCMSLKNLKNVRKIEENGFNAANDLLRNIFLELIPQEDILYWIFDIEKDKLITDKYQNVSENNFESYIKIMLENIYNKISILTYEILVNEINESSNNIFELKKLVLLIQDKFIKLNVRDEYYSKIQKLIYNKKIPKVKNEYDKNEDKIPGITSPLIKIPTVPKFKETEKIIEILEEEKVSFEDTLLQNATCQHMVTFNKIMMLKNKDPSVFDQALYEFIRKYRKINVEGDYICNSCSQLLDIKRFMSMEYQGGIFTLNLSASLKPLEELSKYEKFSKSIKNIDKIINKIGDVMNVSAYIGNTPIVRIKRQEITKTTIDLIETTNELINSKDPLVRKDKLEQAVKNYGINKQLTNYFLFKMDNEIFLMTSLETDKYKKFKYNNILAYIFLLMLLDISNNQVLFFNFDKNYNYLLFNRFGFSLFNNLYIRINNSNDVEPIKNYKILCYLIYYTAGMMLKNNIWYFDQQTKDDKLFQKRGLEIIIHTLIHLLNTITEAFNNNKNNYLFDTISTRFFIKLNTQFNYNDSKDILDKIELQMSDKIDINNNKIRIRMGTQHSKYDLEGKIEETYIPLKKYIPVDSLKLNKKKHIKTTITYDLIKEALENNRYKLLFSKFNKDGSRRLSYLSEKELATYTETDYNNLNYILRNRRSLLLAKFQKVENFRKIKNEKTTFNDKKFIEKMKAGYKKYYDNSYDSLITTFIDKLESIIGQNININNENIYLKENTYIIDHNHLGQSAETKILKDVIYKPNHEYFKQDVLIANRDKIETYYNVIENNLVGYREKGKNYVDMVGTGRFIRVNYSIENKLKYMGFDNKYINTNDYQKNDIFANEKNTKKEISDEIMRNRIFALKRFMEFSQKIIYQIKNKQVIQLIEKGATDLEKIKNKYVSYVKLDEKGAIKRELLLNGDAKIVINFQTKFKYINTTKENNKKILIAWKILNNSVIHDINKSYQFKEKHIDASHLISLNDNDHIIMFYTLSELSYLIDLNDDNYTKSNLVFLISNIINYCYNLFNKQLNHVEYRRFKYMIESNAEIISFDQTTDLQFNQTDEEKVEEKELSEDAQEEKDALDIEQDIVDEEVDDEYTLDEFTRFENRDG